MHTHICIYRQNIIYIYIFLCTNSTHMYPLLHINHPPPTPRNIVQRVSLSLWSDVVSISVFVCFLCVSLFLSGSSLPVSLYTHPRPDFRLVSSILFRRRSAFCRVPPWLTAASFAYIICIVTHEYMYLSIYTHTYSHARMHARAHKHTHTQSHTHTQTHTCTRTCTYLHTHTKTHKHSHSHSCSKTHRAESLPSVFYDDNCIICCCMYTHIFTNQL